MKPLTARQVEEILSDHGFLKGHGIGGGSAGGVSDGDETRGILRRYYGELNK